MRPVLGSPVSRSFPARSTEIFLWSTGIRSKSPRSHCRSSVTKSPGAPPLRYPAWALMASGVVRPVIVAPTMVAAFPRTAGTLRLDLLCHQASFGLYGVDLNLYPAAETAEAAGDPLENRGAIDLEGDLASALGRDLERLCSSVLRDDGAVEVPQRGLRSRCEDAQHERSR